MKYKGYEAKIEYDDEDRLFFGCVINIKDVIVFDGLSVEELEQSFHKVIDEYLADCQVLNKTPEKPISELSSFINAD
jgi:predicted HicB family RNase H-like nuclease